MRLLLLPLVADCLIVSCARLPDTSGRPASHVIRETSGTSLARAVKPYAGTHPSKSGFHPLGDGSDALAARLGLASMAERSLDLQYYIWHNDKSGRQLIAALLAAADRGVRVRVLIDDLGTSAKDENLLALDKHHGIEVRLFNPITTRTARLLGTVLHFGRVNRRMHNKAFIADNRAAIVGGRNIGDEYFDAHAEVNFADFDLVAVGPVVNEVSQSFDDYWNCSSSIRISDLTRRRATAAAEATVRATLAEAGHEHADFVAKLRGGDLRFYPGHATVMADDPQKVLEGAYETGTHLAPKLRENLSATHRELLIVSPYFIPGENGVALLESLRSRGVRVVVLTNSLAATDVAAVHAGYKRYREELIRMGVELYENKPSGGWGSSRKGRLGLLFGGSRGSSRASLHAKTFTFDQRRIFVGSMNLDPRSIHLNTEMGILIDSPDLAGDFAKIILRDLPRNAYRVELDRGKLVWITQENGQPQRFTTEPQTSGLQRLTVDALGLLPIEGQL